MSLIKLGRYDLIRVLGKGAMGLVYEGRDPNLNRRVAIKTIKVDNLSDQAADEYEVRFRTEAHSAARLQHPNIVSVYDSDRDGDMAFLVLEFVEGNDLKHHLDSGEVFTLAQTLSIMSDLLSALAYAHKQKIIHRDVKPANLLVQANGRIKLADFGVARIQDSADATRTQGSIVGTLKYMSPEQLEGRPIDARADLFAAGVVLYQLLTSKRPFDGDTDFAVIQNIVGSMPPAVTFYNPGLPPALDAVVAQSLAKARDQRFSSADEFIDALNSACRGAADASIAPQRVSPAKGAATTWTSTMVAGDSLVATRTGFSTGTGTSANSALLAQEVELVYWKDIRESDDVSAMQQFLLKFPDGIYADLARRKLTLAGVTPVNEGNGLAAAEPMLTDSTGRSQARAKSVAAPSKPVTLKGTAASAASRPGSKKAAVDPDSRRGKSPNRVLWALAGLAAIAVAGAALKMLPAGSSTSAAAAAASAPLSAASAASASLGLGPGETTVVSFGAGSPASGPVVAAAPAAPIAPVAPPVPVAVAVAMPGVAATAAPQSPAASSAASGSPVAGTSATGATGATGAAQRQVARAAAASAAAAAKRPSLAGSTGTEAPGQAAPAPAPAPVPVPAKPKSAPAQTFGAGPAAVCEGRMLLGFQICMREQCAKSAFAQSAVCVERRQMDEKQREVDRGR